VVFDLGGVLIDWDPRHLYRKLFAGDEAAMEQFLATVCTHEWNRCQDAGRSFAEGARLLKAEHPDKAELIDAYGARFDEMIADAARANDIWVGVCGEMAGDIALIPLLLGLGMDELSAGATLVPRVKRAVQSLTIPECRQLVDEALELQTPSEILARCLELAGKRYGDLLG